MLRTLKILCILLKVLMLTRTTIAFSSKDQEDRIAQECTTSPENIPSEPTFSRAFVNFDNRLNERNISVTFRWKQSEFTNGMIQKYRVQYWFLDNLKRIQTSVDISPAKILQHEVYDVKSDTMYYFKVQAHNEFGAGPYTKFINVSTSHENSVPLLLVSSLFDKHVLDIDLQIELHKYMRVPYLSERTYSALEHKLYGINVLKILITCNFNPNVIEIESSCTEIAYVGTAHNLCIDWVARNLYWIQYKDKTYNIMKLDLTLWQKGIVKYDNILKINGKGTFLNVLPSIGYLYWTELISDNQYIIMQSDFDGKNITPFLKNEDNVCFCQYKLLELSSCFQIDNTNIDKPLIYIERSLKSS